MALAGPGSLWVSTLEVVVDAVLFDFGGVLTSSPFEAFAAYEAEAGLPPDTIRRLNATNPDGNAWASIARELYRSADRGRSWSTVWTSPEEIQYLACGR